MIIGLLSLAVTGVLWVALGIVVSSSARENKNLPLIQGGTGMLIVLATLPGLFFAPFPGWLTGICIFLSGVGNYCIFHLMNKAMKIGPNGLTWAMIQSAFTIPFIMGIVFFGVPCSWFRLAGLLLLLTATALMGCCGQNQKQCGGFSRKWLFFTVTGFVLAGLNQCCANLPSYFLEQEKIDFAGLWVRAGLGGAGTAAVWLLHGLFDRKNFHGSGCTKWMFLMAASTLAASVTLFCGLDQLVAAGAGAIGYPVAMGVTIAVFLLYSLIVLRERFSLSAALSIFLCLCGIILLAI